VDVFDCDQISMALIAHSLSEDREGSDALLEPVGAADLRAVAKNLADILARTLLDEGELAGADREEVIERWRQAILRYEAGLGPEE
jgi:hypothetical protein